MYLAKHITLVLFAVYIVFGLSLSGYQDYSKYGSAAAILGTCIAYFLSSKNNNGSNYYFCFVLFLGLSWLWSDQEISVLGNYITAAFGGALFSLLIINRWASIESLIWLLLIPFFLNFYAYINGINLVEQLYLVDALIAEKRFGGFVGHPNALTTRLLAPILILVLFYPRLNETKNKFLLIALCAIASLFCIVATGSKKSLLILAPAIIYLIANNFFEKSNKLSTLIILMGGGILFFLTGKSDYLLDWEIFNRFEMFLLGIDDSTIDRSYMVFIGLDLFLERPIFGYGLGEFSRVSGVGYYSHNNWIELLVNAGFVGLLLYTTLVIKGVIGLYGCHKDSIQIFAIAGILIALDLTGVTYGDRGSLMFVAPLVMLFMDKNYRF